MSSLLLLKVVEVGERVAWRRGVSGPLPFESLSASRPQSVCEELFSPCRKGEGKNIPFHETGTAVYSGWYTLGSLCFYNIDVCRSELGGWDEGKETWMVV